MFTIKNQIESYIFQQLIIKITINLNYFIKFISQILPLLLEILGNMCISIVCYPGCGVIKFDINLIFLIGLFRYMTKKSRQKLK